MPVRSVLSETTVCPICKAAIGKRCANPSGSVYGYSHKARVMLAILGTQHETAVVRVHNMTEDYNRRYRQAAAKRNAGWPVERLIKAQKESASEEALDPDDIDEDEG